MNQTNHKRDEMLGKVIDLADEASDLAMSFGQEASQVFRARVARVLQQSGVVTQEHFDATIAQLEARIKALEQAHSPKSAHQPSPLDAADAPDAAASADLASPPSATPNAKS